MAFNRHLHSTTGRAHMKIGPSWQTAEALGVMLLAIGFLLAHAWGGPQLPRRAVARSSQYWFWRK